MHFSPDGSNLITSSDDDQVTIVFLKSQKQVTSSECYFLDNCV
jgi:hypothetical protein